MNSHVELEILHLVLGHLAMLEELLELLHYSRLRPDCLRFILNGKIGSGEHPDRDVE